MWAVEAINKKTHGIRADADRHALLITKTVSNQFVLGSCCNTWICYYIISRTIEQKYVAQLHRIALKNNCWLCKVAVSNCVKFQTHTSMKIHTHTHTHTHTHIHVPHTHARAHTCARAHTHTTIHLCLLTYLHIHAHTQMRARAHTHTHTYTHTHTHTHTHT